MGGSLFKLGAFQRQFTVIPIRHFETAEAALLAYFEHIFEVIPLKCVQWPSTFFELRVSYQ
jgi:hypothetical protein